VEVVILDLREQAVRFTMGVLRHATDWQDGQFALAKEDRFSPLFFGDDLGDLTTVQSIIREAEERLGDDLPY
jgi:hypothetical protein